MIDHDTFEQQWEENPDLNQSTEDEQDSTIPLLNEILSDSYRSVDPELLKEMRAITERIDSELTLSQRESLQHEILIRKDELLDGLTSGYPSAPLIIEMGWAVMARAIYEACFHPEVHASRFGHYMNMATLIGGIGDEPRLCLNMLRADAWREVQRNEIYLHQANEDKRKRYMLRVLQHIVKNLQFMYWETGLPVGLENAQYLTQFDWQAPQFEAIRNDKFWVLHELERHNKAIELFAAIENRSTILRQQRPQPTDPSLPSWSACEPEYAQTSFTQHSQMLIERQKQRVHAISRYDWDEI